MDAPSFLKRRMTIWPSKWLFSLKMVNLFLFLLIKHLICFLLWIKYGFKRFNWLHSVFGNFFKAIFLLPCSLVSSSTWFQSPLLALLSCRISMWYCNSGQNSTLLYSLSLQLPEYLVLVLLFSLLEIPSVYLCGKPTCIPSWPTLTLSQRLASLGTCGKLEA